MFCHCGTYSDLIGIMIIMMLLWLIGHTGRPMARLPVSEPELTKKSVDIFGSFAYYYYYYYYY